MHAASLDRSPRLQRVHALLSDGVERSTLEIIAKAKVCAVNSCISELRVNGFRIACCGVALKIDPLRGVIRV
ncbi:MAG: hypothetical protein F4X97_10160, partial [Boseongicola sp. SB0662_bin_57]|nr:hypothetical protein [Boseongicola sp. SB0662_bin_57]